MVRKIIDAFYDNNTKGRSNHAPRKKKQSESVSIAQFKELPENLQEFQVSDDFRRNETTIQT